MTARLNLPWPRGFAVEHTVVSRLRIGRRSLSEWVIAGFVSIALGVGGAILVLGWRPPVSASHCVPRLTGAHSVALDAQLTNNINKVVTSVGVVAETSGLEGTDGSWVEYIFSTPLAPSASIPHLRGHEYEVRSLNVVGQKVELLPPASQYSVAAHLGAVRSCWTQSITYADGTSWSVSPL